MGLDQIRLHKMGGISKGASRPNTLPEKSPFSGLPRTYTPNRSAQTGTQKAAAAKYSAYKAAIKRE